MFRYAPILIPTLNRIEHLRRCVESLSKCKYANQTEIYISLDFPPSAKYEEGYLKVKSFLQKGIRGFKAVHIYYQTENLGPADNFMFLRSMIIDKNDTYITTEDDNEFSYNFLEYMNKGLMIFEKDDNILNICAVRRKGLWNNQNETITFQQICPAYGLGCWKRKELQLEKVSADFFLKEIGENKEKINLLWRSNKMCYQQFIEGVLLGKNPLFWKNDKTVKWCDTIRSIYAICSNKYFVVPRVSKVRNWGLDGSGVNMKRKKIDPRKEYLLDLEKGFEFSYSFNQELIKQCNLNENKYTADIFWGYIIKAKLKYHIYNIIK